MNNTVAGKFENFDKLYSSVPPRGTAVVAEENGPLNNMVNSMVNTNIANSRFEFTKTILERSDNPYGLGSVMLDQNKYQALPDGVKGIVADVVSKLLNYKDINNIEAVCRAEIDLNLLDNINHVNYNEPNFNGSGDKVADIKVLIESLGALEMSKPLLNDPTGAVGPIMDMLVILKSSGNVVAYNLALELLNKMETYASVTKVIKKAVSVSRNLQVSMNIQTGMNSGNVSFNRNLVAGAGEANMSIDAMIGNMTNTLVNLVNPVVQANMPHLMQVAAYLSQSIPTLLQLDSVKTFNTLITQDMSAQISPQQQMVVAAAYGKYKSVFGPDGPINHDLRISIALGYLSLKVQELIQTSAGKLDPTIVNGLGQYASVLDMIAYGQVTANVQPEKLTLNDAVAADIQSGKPFYTLGLYGGNILIANAAKNLFLTNPVNGLPLLHPKNIIESAGTAYNGTNINQGINFIMVRTFIEKIPMLKPYIETNKAQLDELAQAITSALVRLQLHA